MMWNSEVQLTGTQSSAAIGHFHQFSFPLSSISSKVTLHLCFWNIPWVPSERCCSSVISVALFHIHSSAMLPWSPKVLSTPPASVCDGEMVCVLCVCVCVFLHNVIVFVQCAYNLTTLRFAFNSCKTLRGYVYIIFFAQMFMFHLPLLFFLE